MKSTQSSDIPSAIEIKGALASFSLLTITLRGKAAALTAELEQSFVDNPDFFAGNLAILDASGVPDPADFDWLSIVELLRRHRVIAVAVRQADGATDAQLQAAGLARAENIEIAPRKPLPTSGPPPVETLLAAAPQAEVDTQLQPNSLLPSALGAASAMVIDRPLRSGQQVYARNADLVVLAVVNPGAEVIADGNIHVYAPLRGRALAGASGNTEARIFTTAFAAELVSIGGVYQPLEAGLPSDVQGRPAQVRLQRDGDASRLLIESLTIA